MKPDLEGRKAGGGGGAANGGAGGRWRGAEVMYLQRKCLEEFLFCFLFFLSIFPPSII